MMFSGYVSIDDAILNIQPINRIVDCTYVITITAYNVLSDQLVWDQ